MLTLILASSGIEYPISIYCMQAWIPLLTIAASIHGCHLGDHVLREEGAVIFFVQGINFYSTMHAFYTHSTV